MFDAGCYSPPIITSPKIMARKVPFWDDKRETEFSGPSPIVDTAIEEVKKELEWIKEEKSNDTLEELVPID